MNAHGRVSLSVDGRAPLWLGGLAALGIVAAHCFAYFLMAPKEHARSHLMDATGHQYWGIVAAVALGAAVTGMAAFFVRAPRFLFKGHRRVDLFTFAARRLIPLQLGGFAILEITERTLMGQALSNVPFEPVVMVGIVLQVVVALAASLLLTLLARTLRALLCGAPASSKQTRILQRPATRSFRPSLALGTGAGTWRGPPALL